LRFFKRIGSMANEEKRKRLQKEIQSYQDIPGDIRRLVSFLELIHEQSEICNMPAVKMGLEYLPKKIASVLQNIKRLETAQSRLNNLNEGRDERHGEDVKSNEELKAELDMIFSGEVEGFNKKWSRLESK